MQLTKIILLATALATPVLAIPPTEKYPNSREIPAAPSPKKSPTPIKTGNDIDKIISATTMVNSYVDRVSLYGNKATQSLAALSYFLDLITTFREINEENTSTPPSKISDSDKFTLCTTVWNLIYKERNLAEYLGIVSDIFVKQGFGSKTIDAIDLYEGQAAKFFHELISRLDVCQAQLDYALEDLTDTIDITKTSLASRIKAANQASTKQDSKSSKKTRSGLWGRDLE